MLGLKVALGIQLRAFTNNNPNLVVSCTLLNRSFTMLLGPHGLPVRYDHYYYDDIDVSFNVLLGEV